MNSFYVYTIKTFLKYLFFVALLILMLLVLSSIWTLSVSLSETEYTSQELVSIAAASSLIDVNKVVPIIAALEVEFDPCTIQKYHFRIFQITVKFGNRLV